MFEYQEAGINWLRDRPRSLLGDDAGLGKSRQMLLAAEGRTLVIAPAMVLTGGVWTDEHARWRPDLDLTQVSYSSLTARELTGKGKVTRPTDRLREEFLGHWDTIICDEAHNLKGRKTTWTVATTKLRSDRLMLATGTPIPNWASELWSLLRLIYPNDKRFSSYWRWVKGWFEVGPTRWSPMDVGDPLDDSPEGWDRFYAANLEGIFLRRLRDDVLPDLPPLTAQTLSCPMVPSQLRVYKQIRKDFIAWLDSGASVKAWNTADQSVKLAKIVSGLETLTAGKEHGSGKLEMLKEQLSNQSGPTLIIGFFRPTIDALETLVAATGRRVAVLHGGTPPLFRTQIIRGFQAGDYDALVGSVEVVAEGLTLTRANTVHVIERSWRPSRNEQVIRRVHRIGQTRPVTVYYYITPKTVDSRMTRLLGKKTDQQMKALGPSQLRELVEDVA